MLFRSLGGRGFEALTQQGAKVRRGDALIRFDAASIKKEGKPLTTIIALTNGEEKAKKIEKHLEQSERVLTVQL